MQVIERFSQAYRPEVEAKAFNAFVRKKGWNLAKPNDESNHPIIMTDGKKSNMELSTFVYEDGVFHVTLIVGGKENSVFHIREYNPENDEVRFSTVA